jgi:hypothetical protein
MKCLSIRQPWAWAILHADKDVENRTWATDYRGPILLHAGQKLEDQAVSEIEAAFGLIVPDDLPRGGIVGAVRIVGCVQESASSWFSGPFGFVLADSQPLPFLPLRGQLGIFDVPEAALKPIAAGIAALTWSAEP